MISLLLHEFVIVFAVAAAVVILFNFFKQPPITGFIVTGILLGPSGFAWIKDTDTIHLLAEIGLIFLLFSIGIEFSFKTLVSMRRAFFGGGTLQIALTCLLVSTLLLLLGLSLSMAILLGFLVSLSSTAIVLNLLHRRRDLLSPHGQLSVAVLLFQDLFAIPLLLLLPLFSEAAQLHNFLSLETSWTLLKAALLFLLVFVGSRFVVPAILNFIAGTGVRELFLITIALLAFGSAWFGAELGLSVIFGAFLAGMLVSETQYGHQVIADLVPLREPFVALFFISVGMLLDLTHFAEHWPLILAMVLGVMLVKFLVGTLSAFGLRYEIRTAVLTGLLLAQIGEFSFVIAEGALKVGVLDAFHYQFFLSVSIVTMILSPTLMFFAPQAVTMLERSDKLVRFLQVPVMHKKAKKRAPSRREHVIIIGLGVIGQNLTKLLSKNHIPCIGIENDSRLAHRLSSQQHLTVIFGDGAKREILEAADLSHAKLVVVAINDANWTPRVVASIRHLRPEIEIIVRCQYFKEVPKFKSHEKNEFVVAEAEMAIAFSEKVLQHFGVDQESISASIEETRSGLLN